MLPRRAEATPEAPEVFTLDFAHFANGTGITSDLVFVNVGTHPIRPALYFYDTEGAISMTRRIGGGRDGRSGDHRGRRLTVLTEMEPLGELTISTHGQGELVSGIGEGALRRSHRRDRALWRPRHRGGRGGSQPTRQRHPLPGPPPGGRNPHGGALHNLGEEAMGVSCRLMSGGVALEEAEIPLAANGQASWFIEEAFPTTDTSDFAGSVRCTAAR